MKIKELIKMVINAHHTGGMAAATRIVKNCNPDMSSSDAYDLAWDIVHEFVS